jgi:diaminopimelate epimerase
MISSFPISFTKMSGTGNDFIIIDHRNPLVPAIEQPEFVKKVCRRMFAVGADGLIFIEKSDKADFSWRFFNADGSVAEMCGNGARCAARFAFLNRIAGSQMRFETLAGIIEAETQADGATVRLRMTPPCDFRMNLKITLGGCERQLHFVNTGVPHAVLFVDDEDTPVKEWGRAIRNHTMFQPAGSNANFVKLLENGEIKVRTYERGVEDETMACGTGAVASALLAGVLGKVQSPVDLITSGGERLKVLFDLDKEQRVDNIFLQGPARIIYEGKLTAESLL